MKLLRLSCASLFCVLAPVVMGQTTPNVRLLLPERVRLLQGQLVDLVLEVRNAKVVNGLRVTAGSNDITSKFLSVNAADLDCGTAGFVIRANQMSFDTPGAL